MIRRYNIFWKNLKNDYRKRKNLFRVFFFLRFLVIAVLIRQIALQNYENIGICILTLILLITPYFIESTFNITIPEKLEIIILLFIYSAEILGEINSFYTIIPHFDTILHTINGFLAASIGFSLVYILNQGKGTFNLSPIYLAVVAFCFSMTIGVLWEFCEFTLDMTIGTDCQKDTLVFNLNTVILDPEGLNNVITIPEIHQVTIDGNDLSVEGYIDIGLIDTMKDLFVNFIGALSFSILGYLYVLHGNKGKIVNNLITTKTNKKDE